MTRLRISLVKIFVSLFVLSLLFLKASASPLCHQLFLKPTTAEINDVFDHYEKLSYDVDILFIEFNSLKNDPLGSTQDFKVLFAHVSELKKQLANIEERLLLDETVQISEFDGFIQQAQALKTSLGSLVAKTTAPTQQPSAPAKAPAKSTVTFSRNAEKDISHLQLHYKSKFEEFINEISQISRLSLLHPRWSLEKVSMHEILKDQVAYTVRLNQGYRVLFTLPQHNEVHIVRVSKSLTHNN